MYETSASVPKSRKHCSIKRGRRLSIFGLAAYECRFPNIMCMVHPLKVATFDVALVLKLDSMAIQDALE